jgi:transmembrane sensor
MASLVFGENEDSKETMTGGDDPMSQQESLKHEAWRWVLHMTSGDATMADIGALERWCAKHPRHAEAFARASGAWRVFGLAAENVARQQGLKQEETHSARRKAIAGSLVARRAVLGGAIGASAAAAVVVAVRPPFGLWPSLGELSADYHTAVGEQRRIALSDGVSIEMNTRTSLDIRSAADQGKRIKLIAGEAAIATETEPVEVTAVGGRARADKAQFNILCEDSAVCVSCLAGVVQVEQRGRSLLLQQKQQVSYTADGLGMMRVIDTALVVGWRDGDLSFHNEPLSRVIDEINRYRPGRIILMNKELGRRLVTAHFRLERLDVVIAQLRETFEAKITSLPGGLVLVS